MSIQSFFRFLVTAFILVQSVAYAGSDPLAMRGERQKTQAGIPILEPEYFFHDRMTLESLVPHTDIFLYLPFRYNPKVSAKYAYVDPNHEIPEKPKQMALTYYDQLYSKLENRRYLGVVDYQQYSHNERLYLMDMQSGLVFKTQVAHGEGSDPDSTGYAISFSNVIDSHMSSLGAFITAESYEGKYGLSLRIDGIEPTNSRMRERAIVIHGSKYVEPSLDPIGNSWGCLAISFNVRDLWIDRIKEGVLFYAWFEPTSINQ